MTKLIQSIPFATATSIKGGPPYYYKGDDRVKIG